MSITRPTEKIGTKTTSMEVVQCPTCGLPAWANLMKPKSSSDQPARTVCCGAVVKATPR